MKGRLKSVFLQNRMSRRLLGSSLLILMLMECAGQPFNLFFEHLKPSEGLKNRFNDFIWTDARGFVWISSMEGVYRFDGLWAENFTTANTNGGEGRGLLSNDIQSGFFEDSQGNIWFTPQNGINCYERKTGAFLAFQLEHEGQKIDNGYCLFHLERDSILWLKADWNIYRYNVRNGHSEKIMETRGYRFAVDTLADGRLKSIYACPWLKAEGIELITRTSDGNFVKRIFLDNGLPPGHRQFSQAIIEHDSLAWLFSKAGLAAFNPYRPEALRVYALPSGEEDFVKGGAIGNERYLFVITKGSGLWLFDRRNRKFTQRHTFEEGKAGSVASNDLREVYLDKRDHLWLASHDKAAISHAWIGGSRFTNPFDTIGSLSVQASSIVEDGQGLLWCSTPQDGLFAFSKNGSLQHHFSYEGELVSIHHLSCDAKGSVWALAGQALYQRQNGRLRKVYNSRKEQLLAVLHLSESHKLLTTNQGLFILKKGPSRWEKEPWGKPEEYNVFYASSSPDGQVHYCANQGGQLSVLRWKDDTLCLDTSIEVGTDVYSIRQEEGQLILGAFNGALRLDLSTGQFSNLFPDQELLRNTPVFFIDKDERGRYWLATGDGIWCYSTGSGELYQYREGDGLPSQEFQLYAHAQPSDGKIWLGASKGLVVFHPDSIRPYPYGPKIMVKSLMVNSEPYKPELNIEEMEKLAFPHDKNTLEFELMGLTHYLAKFNKVYFRLEGYDEEWKILENGGKAKFVQVPSGTYHLRMYGVNANGLRGPEKALEITIHPPFWLTPEFLIPFFLAAAIAAYFIFRFFLRKSIYKKEEEFRRREEMQKALQEERNRIASEMHEDLAGGLTSIQLLIKNMKKKESAEERVVELRRVENYAAGLVENMKEIIWAMNGNYDNLPDLAAYMRHFLVEYLDVAGIECETNIPHELPSLMISGKKRRNIFLCLKECAHNIVKHSSANQVYFSMLFKDGLYIEVRDNGTGFSPGRDNRFSNGLRNMKHRMQQIGATMEILSDNGTTVKMKIPLEKETETSKTP